MMFRTVSIKCKLIYRGVDNSLYCAVVKSHAYINDGDAELWFPVPVVLTIDSVKNAV